MHMFILRCVSIICYVWKYWTCLGLNSYAITMKVSCVIDYCWCFACKNCSNGLCLVLGFDFAGPSYISGWNFSSLCCRFAVCNFCSGFWRGNGVFLINWWCFKLQILLPQLAVAYNLPYWVRLFHKPYAQDMDSQLVQT